MADISKITLPSGTTYNIKDEVARATAAGGIQLKGVTTTALTDEATTNPIKIGGNNYTAVNQDAVFYGKKEFVFDGTKWHEFGDMSGLGALASKDSASGNYTPAGTVSKPTFTGTQGTVSVSGTPSGTIGTSTASASDNTFRMAVTVPSMSVTLNTPTTSQIKPVSNVGSATAGTAASCTLPTLTTSVANETLTISWTAGSFSANTPTQVTLPTFGEPIDCVTGLAGGSTPSTTANGNYVKLNFTGANTTSTGSFTPAGTVSQPTFTGTEGTVTVS